MLPPQLAGQLHPTRVCTVVGRLLRLPRAVARPVGLLKLRPILPFLTPAYHSAPSLISEEPESNPLYLCRLCVDQVWA